MVVTGAGVYAGEVSVAEAWDGLAATPEATLVDVRTEAEWVYVGLPSLQPLGKALILQEWQAFPAMGVVPDFVARLGDKLDELGVGRDAPLYFICRSGARSRQAAIAMAEAGYSRCYNISPGFEGPLDESRHRGTREGWKVAGLPWTQS